MIVKPQSNRSGLHVNNVTLRSNRNLNRNLTAAAYILIMVTLHKLLRFESQQCVWAKKCMVIKLYLSPPNKNTTNFDDYELVLRNQNLEIESKN